MRENTDAALQEACRELVRRDRKRRPWFYAGMAELIGAYLLMHFEVLPTPLDMVVAIPSLVFSTVTFLRWWSNLFCPKCGRSLLSRLNPYRFFGLWPSDTCVCYFCKTHIPFDEDV